MNISNPFIDKACEQLSVAPNNLPTFIQPQYGQLGEDLIIAALLMSLCARHNLAPHQIRYLDVGANHPIQTSNTYLLYSKFNARGVLVEANPSLIESLNRIRPNDLVINKAVVPSNQTKTVRLAVGKHSELSSVNPEHTQSFGDIGTIDKMVEVSANTLDEMLSIHFSSPPQLLSIDIEGLDLDVLKSSKFPRRPWLIVCEPSRHFVKESDRLFKSAMTAKGYIEVARTEYNLIFMDHHLQAKPNLWADLIERMRAANRRRIARRRQTLR